MDPRRKEFDIKKISPDNLLAVNDWVSVEEPLEIRLVYGRDAQREARSVSVTMRTPGHDSVLTLGFLFTEGIIQQHNQIISITEDGSNIILVELHPHVPINPESISRNFYTTSSCGVCGKSSIEAIRVNGNLVKEGIVVSSSVLKKLPSIIKGEQTTFEATGGLHASALFDREGNLLVLMEDVGRHNALDKVIGSMVLSGKVPLHDTILLVSGRASFELVQKAVVAGIPVVAAIGAPSSLAIELAREKGISLIGFLKNDGFNVYANPHRIQNP